MEKLKQFYEKGRVYLTRPRLELITVVVMVLCALSVFLLNTPKKGVLTLDGGALVYDGLNKVFLKYQGLNGTEIAISESQEWMAVVVRPEDVDAFVAECNKENIDTVVVATVTEKPNLVLHSSKIGRASCRERV